MTEALDYANELREIAGMLAQQPDGPVRWKQYRLAAIADFLATLPTQPVHPSAEAVREACAELAERVELRGVLTPGWADGASSARSQIAANIRDLSIRVQRCGLHIDKARQHLRTAMEKGKRT